MTKNQFGKSFNLAKIEPEIQTTKKLIAFLQSTLDKNIGKKKTSIDLQIAKNRQFKDEMQHLEIFA